METSNTASKCMDSLPWSRSTKRSMKNTSRKIMRILSRKTNSNRSQTSKSKEIKKQLELSIWNRSIWSERKRCREWLRRSSRHSSQDQLPPTLELSRWTKKETPTTSQNVSSNHQHRPATLQTTPFSHRVSSTKTILSSDPQRKLNTKSENSNKNLIENNVNSNFKIVIRIQKLGIENKK